MRSTTITIAALTCLGVAIPANGDIRFFRTGGTPANWSEEVWYFDCSDGGGVGAPGVDDHAVICAGEDSTVDVDWEVKSVSVQKDGSDVGILRIPSGVTLTLNEDGGTSDIDGRLLLTGTLRLDWPNPFDAEHLFTGDGDIKGTASGAKISVEGFGISGASRLTINTTIHGILEIAHDGDGDAILRLDAATIHADANGLLKISLSLVEDVAGNGNSLLKVSTSSGAILDLDFVCNSSPLIPCPMSCLEYTEVEVFKGTFTFGQTFKTNETLTMQTGGKMDVPDAVEGWFDTSVCGL